MIHANLDSIRTKLGDERGEQRCAGGIGRFAGPSKGVGQDAQLQLRILA